MTTTTASTLEARIWERVIRPHGPMSRGTARRLLQLGFSEDEQQRMKELSARNRKGQLTEVEQAELDDYCRAGTLLSVLQANERAYGTSSISVDAKVAFSGGREVRVEDLYSDEGPAMRTAALVAAPLAYLMSNDFERVQIDRVDVEASSYETVKTATLERAWLERSGPVKAGQNVMLKLSLRSYRGDSLSESIPISLPANAPAGSYSLLIADGSTLTNIDQREARQNLQATFRWRSMIDF